MNAPSPHGYGLLRLGRLSLLWHRRSLMVGLALLAALAAAFVFCLSGDGLGAGQAIATLLGQGDPFQQLLVRELRLPRLLAGLLSGAALGAAGCLMQTLARNRLATPGMVGLDNGATAFAVASIVAVPTSLAPSALALTGAASAAALTFLLAAGAGARGYRFIVVGLGIGALFGALTNLMLARADIDAANAAYPWTVGSLNARPPLAVWLLAGGLALGLPAARLLTRPLTTMRFSDSVAIGLGVRLGAMRIATLALSVALTGLAVAVAGPVGLVALIAPEAARYLGGQHGVPVLNAALAGALLTLLADWLGRTLLAPIEIPVGIVMAVIGAPYLLWIILRQPSGRQP
ncbi:iron complex transport system permease protein [Pseudomonas citronellolis]|uniref:Iron complex transport system permease protein n=1 Tax=Pseudomonas citronellolis TaxID=53408 RepID=A0AAQ1KDL0_9PSED|nr:iron ABC transporter permease [Pseudomonas citronellolis]MDN6871063.1 iron ABC transporter permease [Pseudomonas citronellolis]TGC22838.1 iron ABC transporter permease [Pseudomonas citronellolis]TGC29392.1 iron ABC transporter permease [Pseudomonas citronellolis]UUC51681.1 iron ABC transporter permease [Pseudomonas citronellolis]UXJ51499.1 iron ABC transporter permease [Pseudomonas citronellolis]